jgi:translation elongation factor P/translation initiation factor 5A
VKPGKGAAFVRTKLKNQVSGATPGCRVCRNAKKCKALIDCPRPTGNTVEKTFRAGEKVIARCALHLQRLEV